MERTLLLVDDEANILRSLLRLLRQDGYTILTADSGQAGLDLLSMHDVGVIISDQRMPGMSGVEFLSKVRVHHPETVRIVLSGYTDLKSVTDAINEGAIYKFLTKPWDDELLCANVQDAFHHYELTSENERLSSELKSVIEELRKANRELEQHVERKSRYVDMNLRTLQITQDVLESMPMGVLGISNDNRIAVANFRAHQLFDQQSGGLVGENVDKVLPTCIYESYRKLGNGSHTLHRNMNLEDGRTLEVYMSRPEQIKGVQGAILVNELEGGT